MSVLPVSGTFPEWEWAQMYARQSGVVKGLPLYLLVFSRTGMRALDPFRLGRVRSR